MLCKRQKTITPFESALAEISISAINKKIIAGRYNTLLISMDKQALRSAIIFHSFRCTITIGSLIVPALLSIQYTGSVNTNMGIYWTTWVISLLVTICNGLATLLKIDKHYYSIHTVREQLISDGWQYLELTGKYSGFHTPSHPATHENQFIYFCHSIEKIRMKHIQDDYYKVNESQQSGDGATVKTNAQLVPTNLIPPTPQQGELQLLPESMKKVIEELSMTRVEDGQAIQEDAQEDIEKDKKVHDPSNKKHGERESMSMP